MQTPKETQRIHGEAPHKFSSVSEVTSGGISRRIAAKHFLK